MLKTAHMIALSLVLGGTALPGHANPLVMSPGAQRSIDLVDVNFRLARGQCSRQEVFRIAYRKRVFGARIVKMGRHTVTMHGTHRRDSVIVTFANVTGCPVIRWQIIGRS